LTAALPGNSPGRFPHGWYRIDYALEGDLKEIDLAAFRKILEQAVVRHTGWPAFWVPKRREIAPREIDGTIECWLKPEGDGVDRAFGDAGHCDFWRAAPTGRMFLIRGFQEDGQETFPPGTILDTTLPIWRLAESLLHAGRLAVLLRRDPNKAVTVRFRALYSGLSGRVLRSWANPLFVEGAAARGDEAMLEEVIPAEKIESDLAQYVLPLVASLYERFGVVGVSLDRVKTEIDRLKKNQIT
jgi:transcriptional regulator with XRE-family HTH domain